MRKGLGRSLRGGCRSGVFPDTRASWRGISALTVFAGVGWLLTDLCQRPLSVTINQLAVAVNTNCITGRLILLAFHFTNW